MVTVSVAKVSPTDKELTFNLLKQTERQSSVNNPCFLRPVQLEFDEQPPAASPDADEGTAQQVSKVVCPQGVQSKLASVISGDSDAVVMFSVFDSNEVFLYISCTSSFPSEEHIFLT